jgi:hypothetical protein
MTTIKQLPEELYWRSGAIKDGGYAWWLPDDLASYEPLPIDSHLNSENVLVAAGRMSDPAGFVRVIATWTFEFYTPVQLFARDYNCVYGDPHRAVWQTLCRQPAVSANNGHAALVLSLLNIAAEVYNYYKRRREDFKPLRAALQTQRSRQPPPPPRRKSKPQAPAQGKRNQRAKPRMITRVD